MTAKKKGASTKQQPTAEQAAKKTARKQAAKKAVRTKDRTQMTEYVNRGFFKPEVLADLAVKLLQLQSGDPGKEKLSNRPLSDRISNGDFKDALKGAEKLLLAARVENHEEVHAYQLFTEDNGLMSYGEIAERFKDSGWSKIGARNTVESIIEQLVNEAESEVQKMRVRDERLISVRCRYAGGVHYLVDRVRRHIQNMIRRTALRDLFDDPKQVADVMGQFFFKLMAKNISGDWEQHLVEEFAAAVGHESFIAYVCDGLSYENFIGDPLQVRLDLERLGCLVFFLEGFVEDKPSGDQCTKRDLESLLGLVRGSDVPREAKSDFEDCVEEFKKSDPQIARVRELASNASRSLRAMWERWYLSKLAEAQGLRKLINELEDRRSALSLGNQVPAAKVVQILVLLRRALEVGKANATTLEAGEIRQLLDDLLLSLEDPDLIAAAGVPACSFGGMIADELKSVAGGLKKGLSLKPPPKRHAQQSLNDLLNELKPYSGERRCRPYELFLFAAQHRLLKDKLIRKRSALDPGLIPHPPHRSSLSILECHSGVSNAMEEDPG